MAVAWAICSCTDIPIVSVSKSVDVRGWHSRDTLRMSLSPIAFSAGNSGASPEAGDVNPVVGVRLTRSYAYRNLALRVEIIDADTHATLLADTVSYEAYDGHDAPQGRGFRMMELEAPLSRSFRFNPNASYLVKVSHVMRVNPVEGVVDVWVRF